MSTPARPSLDTVAVVLAIGLATAVNAITAAVLVDAITDSARSGLSENGTQILTAAFGGLTGILGSYVGYKAHAAGGATTASRNGPAPPRKEDRTMTTENYPNPAQPSDPQVPAPEVVPDDDDTTDDEDTQPDTRPAR